VQAMAPHLEGPLWLELSLESPTVKATNRYESFIQQGET